MGQKTTAETAKGLFTPEQERRLASWTTRYPAPTMGLIEALRDVQEWRRCVRREDEAYIAKLFKVPLKWVREVATFYPYFTQEPAGKYRIEVCRNITCHLGGCRKVLDHLEKRLGVPEHQATQDGLFSFEAVECLGACEQAPAFSINDELQGTASPETIDRVVEELKAEEKE